MKETEVLYLTNPWSGTTSTMTWGEVIDWAAEHVHKNDRVHWIRTAHNAAKRQDAAELGNMIIGS